MTKPPAEEGDLFVFYGLLKLGAAGQPRAGVVGDPVPRGRQSPVTAVLGLGQVGLGIV